MTASDEDLGQAAILAGATGLVGGLCLRRLLAAPGFAEVVALGRRPPDTTHGRLRFKMADFARLEDIPPIPARAGLSALGTTIKKAGSEAAFRAVDHDAVLAFARWARKGGAATFVLVSSVGASRRSKSFYLRVKGETEEHVAAVGFPRLVILRPSLLLGERAESRPGEALARGAAPFLNPLLLGPLRRYRGVPADAVAAAMAAGALGTEPGRLVWENDEIQRHRD